MSTQQLLAKRKRKPHFSIFVHKKQNYPLPRAFRIAVKKEAHQKRWQVYYASRGYYYLLEREGVWRRIAMPGDDREGLTVSARGLRHERKCFYFVHHFPSYTILSSYPFFSCLLGYVVNGWGVIKTWLRKAVWGDY